MKRHNTKTGFRRSIASLLTIAFLANSIVPAQAQISTLGVRVEKGELGRYFLEQTRLPVSLAITDEKYLGKSSETIWVIRDAHAIPEAQSSIRHTLLALEKQAHVSSVAVEGVSGDFQTAFFKAFPDQKFLRANLKKLWEQGELAGPALAALTGSRADFFGAEDSQLYRDELNAYLQVQAEKAGVLNQIKMLQSEIERSAQKHFSEKLKQFESLRQATRDHDPQATERLLQFASKELVDFSKQFPYLSMLLEEGLDVQGEDVRAALTKLSEAIRTRISKPAQLKTWSALEQAWHTQQKTDAQFAAEAWRFCRKQGWNLSLPKVLQHLTQRGLVLTQMRSQHFMREWQSLLKKLENRIAVSQIEKETMTQVHGAELLELLAKLEMAREDWEKVQSKQGASAHPELENFRSEMVKSHFGNFYRLAEAREKALLKNTLAHLKQTGKASVALVVGGFHGDFLIAELKKQKISYAVLTPAISSLPKENRYDALMRGDVSWKKFIKVENNQVKLYESFARAMTHELLDLEGQKKDPTLTLQHYKTWRENLMRGARGQDREENLAALYLLDTIVLETVYPSEYAALSQKWQPIAKKITPVFERLKKIGKLGEWNLQTQTAAYQVGAPLVIDGVQFPRVEVPVSVASVISAKLRRSEFRSIKEIWHIMYEGPDAKFGGLGDVGNDLPPAMTRILSDANISAIMPWHAGKQYPGAKHLKSYSFDTAEGLMKFEAFEWYFKGARYILLAKIDEEIFNGYQGDVFRLGVLFSKAAVEYLAQSNIAPDILHAHDQMASYAVPLARHTRGSHFWKTALGYTAHHLAPEYQGANYDFNSGRSYLMGVGLNDRSLYQWGGAFYLHRPGNPEPHINPVHAAIVTADGVTTVDPEFAREAATEGWDFTEGLREALYRRFHDPHNRTFIGIPNALNREDWDPMQAPINHRVSFGDKRIITPGIKLQSGSDFFDWKTASRVWLQQTLGLKVNPNAPVFFAASRLTRVKGLDAIALSATELLRRFQDLQIVIAGTGESHYEDQFAALAGMPDFHGRFNYRRTFLTEPEMRAGFAGATHFLSPTTVAPFEISPSQAKLFGTPSVVTNTGGLMRIRDPHLDSGLNESDRFGWRFGSLTNASPAGFSVAAASAIMDYQYKPETWLQTSENVQGAVPSWDPVVRQYDAFYHTIFANRMDLIGEHEIASQVRAYAARSELRKLPNLNDPHWGGSVLGWILPKAVPGFVVVDLVTTLGLFFRQTNESGNQIRAYREAARVDEARKAADIRESVLTKTAPEKEKPATPGRPEVRDGAARSELRERFINSTNFPLLSKQNVYSVQFESGYPLTFIETVWRIVQKAWQHLREKPVRQWLSMSVLTGGLGALMTDLFEAWRAIGMNITGLHPLWNLIKNTPRRGEVDGQKLQLGEIAKQGMKDTGEEFEVELNVNDKFVRRVLDYRNDDGSLSQARFLLADEGHKKIKVRVYQTKSAIWKTPHFYFDAFLEDGTRVFDEVYNDDRPMREFQMALFNRASQLFIQLREKNPDPENIVILAHETFVSLPFRLLKKALLVTLNHTVFRPGLEEPSEDAYELLDFEESERSQIVVNGKISIADYAARNYHMLAGVALVEHTVALLNNIFRVSWHKVRRFYDFALNIRNTNGVFLQRWQNPLLRKLIKSYKKQLGVKRARWYEFSDEASDKEFFRKLDETVNAGLKEEFINRQSWITAAAMGRMLVWLREKRNFQGHRDWIEQILGNYSREQGISDLATHLNDFQRAVEEASKTGGWDGISVQYAQLTELLLSNPIAQNLRRQVPYKGPDKYEELLIKKAREAAGQIGVDSEEGKDRYYNFERVFYGRFEFWKDYHGHKTEGRDLPLTQDHERYRRDIADLRARLAATSVIQDLKNEMARVLIGGRTFDSKGSYERYLYLQFLSEILGVEDRFGFVDDYNQYEAAILFQGVQAGIMLSDEKLEAAATGWMKDAVNGGATYSVYGGAPPEGWDIRDRQGNPVDVLDQDGDPAFTYDELIAKLDSGEWTIRNGGLIRYNRDEKSFVGGDSRPSAESLEQALKDLQRARKNPEKRRAQMYSALSNSYRLDMVTGQASAHAYLIEAALKERQERKELFAKITVNLGDYAAATQGNVFAWNATSENIYFKEASGLIGFVRAFNRMATWQKYGKGPESRGEMALASLKFHSEKGDIFNYILDELKRFSTGVEPLRKKIRKLQQKATEATKERIRVEYNLEALNLIDQFFLHAAGEWFENYFKEGATPVDFRELREALEVAAVDTKESGAAHSKFEQPWSAYIARYLDRHPRARSMETKERRIRSFIFEKKDGKGVIVNLSVAAATRQEQDKSRGLVYKSSTIVNLTRAALIKLGITKPAVNNLYWMTEPKRGERYKLHTEHDLLNSLGIGISLPFGIEVLELKPFEENKLFEALRMLVQGKSGESVLIQKIAAINGGDSSLLKDIDTLEALDIRSATHVLGDKGMRAFMAFVLMAAPDKLERFKHWDEHFFSKLNMLKTGIANSFFTEQANTTLQAVGSTTSGAMALSRKAADGKILFVPIVFFVSRASGDKSGAGFDHSLNSIIPTGKWQITDGFDGRGYEPGYESSSQAAWDTWIPLEDRMQPLILALRSESRDDKEDEDFFDNGGKPEDQSPASSEFVLWARGENFAWKDEKGKELLRREAGILGFFRAFHELFSWQKPGESIQEKRSGTLKGFYRHAARGDFFTYFLSELSELKEISFNGQAGLLAEIRKLQSEFLKLPQRVGATNLDRKAMLQKNLEAINLVEKALEENFKRIAGEWVEDYLAAKTPGDVSRLQKLLITAGEVATIDSNEPVQPWSEYIARYLRAREGTVELQTQNPQIRSFVVPRAGQSAVMLNLNVFASAVLEENDPFRGRVYKSKTSVKLSDEAIRLLTGMPEGPIDRWVEIREPQFREDYKLRHAQISADGTIPNEDMWIAVSLPLGVEILEWRSVETDTTWAKNGLAVAFNSAFRKEHAAQVKDATKALKDVLNQLSDLDSLQANIDQMKKWDGPFARYLFTREGRRAVMAFILMKAPDLFDKSFQAWDFQFYEKLAQLQKKQPALFEEEASELTPIVSDDQQSVLFIRKNKDGEMLMMPMILGFDPGIVYSDSVGLKKARVNFQFSSDQIADHTWIIEDGLMSKPYPNKPTSALGAMGVPTEDLVQFLVLKPNRAELRDAPLEREARSEFRLVPALDSLAVLFTAQGLAKARPADFVPAVIVEEAQSSRVDLAKQKALIREMIDGLDAFVQAHPNVDLNLGFVMAYNPDLADEFIVLAQKIKELKRAPDGNRIHNRLVVVFTADQMQASELTAKQIREAGAQAATMTEAEILVLMRRNQAVFAYGFDGVGASELQHLFVQNGGLSMAAVFPAAFALNMQTAEAGKITPQMLGQLSPELAVFFGRVGRSLKVLPSILQAKWLEIMVAQLTSAAA